MVSEWRRFLTPNRREKKKIISHFDLHAFHRVLGLGIFCSSGVKVFVFSKSVLGRGFKLPNKWRKSQKKRGATSFVERVCDRHCHGVRVMPLIAWPRNLSAFIRDAYPFLVAGDRGSCPSPG